MERYIFNNSLTWKNYALKPHKGFQTPKYGHLSYHYDEDLC